MNKVVFIYLRSECFIEAVIFKTSQDTKCMYIAKMDRKV